MSNLHHAEPFAGVEAPTADEFDGTLPQLQEIMATPIPTSLHVPKPLRQQWNRILHNLLAAFLNHGSRKSFQLLMAPKCLFAPLPRAGSATSRMSRKSLSTFTTRFRRWSRGD